ncbi:hypothetical protein CCM_06454 [Cordyceps militaris CM01]|uniref:C2H2-type domain-containing protein n=1 Tax=Cordyceps militaris (strain CM01) TaxID=983644 RepID=G3JME6_CORMM|nr:uncharacterized protein CCM_06454 [Cordyceps militaris CM01]EGX90034.1 hypothetical protein CCM_06454 [Cordyceps militaris CM01]
MSHLAPRPPQRPAHHRTRSHSQPVDKRAELVAQLEGCIGQVLEATKAYKSPQQQTAHQNANQMFQQRVMASQGHAGNMSEQDWFGTMMQCLNESTRTLQSSFVRNTTLDVALKAFASGVFDALGPGYFQESIDKFLASSKANASNHTTIPHHAAPASGILSPPREIGPGQSFLQHPLHNLPPSSPHPSSFPSAHHQLVQRPANHVASGLVAGPYQQMQNIPTVRQPVPPVRGRGRPPKRPAQSEVPNLPAQKRAYASEALRQAAGPMRPPPTPTHAQPSHGNALKPRLCIDFWDVQQERDPRRRQAILGYGGKWYVFQCHQHHQVVFFQTAEGARHHMMTRHALPSQHIDFLDIVRELGVEVMNCDAARAEKNNLDAVNIWNRSDPTTAGHQDTSISPHGMLNNQTPLLTAISATPNPDSQFPISVRIEYGSLPRTQLISPSTVSLSDDEGENMAVSRESVVIKKEPIENELDPSPVATHRAQSTDAPSCSPQSSEPVGGTTEGLETSPTASLPTRPNKCGQIPAQAAQEERTVEPPAKESTAGDVSKVVTERPAETRDMPEQTPDLTPDSPSSSELSEPPSLEELDSFETRATKADAPKVIDADLEEGEIDESCIRVAPCSPVTLSKTIASSTPKKKRRITAAGSASGSRRTKLPSTPKSAQKKRRERQSFWSPSQMSGPSAHDQFKTKPCKKCPERFYFRAQLATHMMSEHPDRRLRAHLDRRLPHQLREVIAVRHRRLRGPVLREHLGDLLPRVRRRHGPGVEDLRVRRDVEAHCAREVHRLCEAGRHGDEEEVGGELCAQAGANVVAAVHGRLGDGAQQRRHAARRVRVPGQHAHQLALLGRHAAAADGHLEEAAAGAAHLRVERAAAPHGHGARVDDGRAAQRRGKGGREQRPVRGVVEEHGEDDVGLLRDGGRVLGRAAVPDGDGEVLGEVERHGRAHGAEADEADAHLGLVGFGCHWCRGSE